MVMLHEGWMATVRSVVVLKSWVGYREHNSSQLNQEKARSCKQKHSSHLSPTATVPRAFDETEAHARLPLLCLQQLQTNTDGFFFLVLGPATAGCGATMLDDGLPRFDDLAEATSSPSLPASFDPLALTRLGGGGK